MESKIINEIEQAIKNIPENFIDEIICEIKSFKRIFLWGLGRSGMMARAFAMRLRHLGLESYFISELCPPIKKRDLLIIISKTGKSTMIFPPVMAAISSKARIICITATRNKLSRICDKCYLFKLPKSNQFGGSLFEQITLIFFDELVEKYRKHMGITFEQMKKNHANWE